MAPLKKRFGFCLLPMAVVISGALLFVNFSCCRIEHCLQITDSNSGKVYGKWPLNGIEEFAIEFIHSVNQSPVRETFIIEEGKIRPLSVRFSSFGAGMQSSLEDGLELGRDGDAMVITGFKNSFSELNYIVGTVSDHLLFVGSEIISLRELCGRNAHIRIFIK